MITQKELKDILHYDPDTGEWGRYKGKRKVGTLHPDGYIRIRVNGRIYPAHCLAWLYITGAYPADEIDHRDLDKSNNKWKNLRASTSSENKYNKLKQINNTSGYKGVSPKPNGKFIAQITIQGKTKHLGTFKTPEEAFEAYKNASLKYHKSFAKF